MSNNVTVISDGPPKVITIAVPGLQGAPGDFTLAELLASTHETYTQPTPLPVWTITHTLNKKPSVTVIDSANDICVGDVHYISDSVLTVTFSAAFSGSALLN